MRLVKKSLPFHSILSHLPVLYFSSTCVHKTKLYQNSQRCDCATGYIRGTWSVSREERPHHSCCRRAPECWASDSRSLGNEVAHRIPSGRSRSGKALLCEELRDAHNPSKDILSSEEGVLACEACLQLACSWRGKRRRKAGAWVQNKWGGLDSRCATGVQSPIHIAFLHPIFLDFLIMHQSQLATL